MSGILTRGILAGVVLAGAGVSAVNGAIIYTDDMEGTAVSDVNNGAGFLTASGGWSGIWHTGGTGTAAASRGTRIIDANDPGTNSKRVIMTTTGSAQQSLLYAKTADFDTAVSSSQLIQDYDAAEWSFTYWTRNDNSPTVRFAVKVDSTWYVRNAASTLLTTDGNNWSKFEVADPFGTSGWTILNFTEFTSLDRITLTGVASLPTTGTLSSVGVWSDRSGGTYGTRLDLVEIDAELLPETPEVPEPASLAVLGLGGLALLVRRRGA